MYLFRNKFVALLLVITPKSFWPMKKLSSLFSLFLLIPLFAVASEVGDRTIPAEVAQLADSLKQKFAPDKRVALFDVDYSFSGKNVMLRGVTTSAEAKTALLDGLAKKGYAVMDCLQVLSLHCIMHHFFLSDFCKSVLLLHRHSVLLQD